MTNTETKSPEEERADRLKSLRSRWNSLSTRATLGNLSDEIEDMGGKVNGAAHRIEALRARGYIYGRGWETQAEALQKSWPERARNARRILTERKNSLRDPVKNIEAQCDRTRLSDREMDQLDNLINRAESQINSAESAVRGAFDTLQEQFSALESSLDWMEKALDTLDSASFKLFPDERVVSAGEAIWVSEKEEPKGYLFLTDSRIVFEQREKKATKKVLFVTTKSEMVQEKLWETPVGGVADIEIEDQKGGFLGLGSKEMLTLRFHERTRELPGDVTLQVKGTTNEWWQGMIKRVQTGEINADRYNVEPPAGTEAAATPPPAPAPSPAEIPTKCPTCGGKLPTVFKGMREITCEYCGNTVRF